MIGNGPYTNRGCEAIVRGTTRILDETFGNQTSYVAASFGTEPQITAQATQETFPRLRHEWLKPKGRASVDYLKYQMNRFLGIKTTFCNTHVPTEASQCTAALQVGGDNYSFDSGGYPRGFMQIDHWLERHDVPLVLWGASVGPFDRDTVFEREMTDHLARFCLISVREPRSFRYLQELGLKNISQAADPAFLMEPQPVTDMVLPSAFLGLNLSFLSGRKVTGGNLDKWVRICAASVTRLLSKCDLPVVLIPHVLSPGGAEANDHVFLHDVARIVNMSDRVTVLGADYTAAQLKWVIGKATVFAGARMHSTIAALSMGVPTLSLAYSVKAWGVNEDVFGHVDHCIDVVELAQEEALADRMTTLLKQKDSVQRELKLRLPVIRASAMKAGVTLRESLRVTR